MSDHDTKKLIEEFDRFAEEGGYESTFVKGYPFAYALFEKKISSAGISAGDRIFDMGCGDPWTAILIDRGLGKTNTDLTSETRYLGVDPSTSAIKALNNASLVNPSMRVQGVVGTADDLIVGKLEHTINESLGDSPTFVICNAAFHQIKKFGTSIEDLLDAFSDLCIESNGKIILGDYYYPESVSDSQLQESLDFIERTTGQVPSSPDIFVPANSIEDHMLKRGLRVVARDEVRANEGTWLVYYNFTFGR